MYLPLTKIQPDNTRCRISLTQLLAERYEIKSANTEGSSPFGWAFFFAFDPIKTCLRLPRHSFRYFTAAERAGLIQRSDVDRLFRKLIPLKVRVSEHYQGFFQDYFDKQSVQDVFSQIDLLEALQALDVSSESGLDVGTSPADILFEACPWPLFTASHLQYCYFEDVKLSDEEFTVQPGSLWKTWTTALDRICLGPWLRLPANDIARMLDLLNLEQSGRKAVPPQDKVLGQRVSIPIFANGFQGVVRGFFRHVPPEKKGALFTTLGEFGQTLADRYAFYRQERLKAAIAQPLDDQRLIEEIVAVISPVSKVIVERDERRIGLGLKCEEDYLAGYHTLLQNDLAADAAPRMIRLAGRDGLNIYVEPLAGVPGLEASFYASRIESFLTPLFNATTVTSETSLQVSEIDRLFAEFKSYADSAEAPIAKLRQWYVIDQVKRNWEKGKIDIANEAVRAFFKNKHNRELKTGYQLTSFATEIERLFDNKVTVTKSRNNVVLSWNPNANPPGAV